MVPQVAVVDVGRVLRIEDLRRPPPDGRVRNVGRQVDDLRRIANSPGTEKELLVLATRAIEHGTDTDPVGDDLGTDPQSA